MENVVNLEQLNYRDQLIKEYIDSKIQPSPEPTPVQNKEKVVDFTFHQRKWCRYQNRILMTNNSQEWPMWFEIGHLKNAHIDSASQSTIEMDIPSWFDFDSVDINKDGAVRWTLAYKLWSDETSTWHARVSKLENGGDGIDNLFTIQEGSENKKLIINTSAMKWGRMMIETMYIYARTKLTHPSNTEQFKPYIITYTPQGIKREYVYNEDIKVMHSHFTIKVRDGRIYKGEFDQPKKKTSFHKSRAWFIRCMIQMFRNEQIPPGLQGHLWMKTRYGNRRNTKTHQYSNLSFTSGGEGYSSDHKNRTIFVPLRDFQYLFTQGRRHGRITREIAYTQEPWKKSASNIVACNQRVYLPDRRWRKKGENYKNWNPISNSEGFIFWADKRFIQQIGRGETTGLYTRIRKIDKTRDRFRCRKTFYSKK